MVHLMMLELAELSLDEPELEAMLFLDDGNEGEENETGSVRLWIIRNYIEPNFLDITNDFFLWYSNLGREII